MQSIITKFEPFRSLAAALGFVVMMSGSTAMSSLFVVYRSEWGLTPADIAIVFSAYVGTLLPVLLLFGGFADRFGRRRVIVTGILFMIAGIVTLMLARDLHVLIVARLFQGIGVGLSGGALSAIFTETHRGKISAGNAIQSWTALGLSAGPVLTAIAFNLGGSTHLSYLPMLILVIAILGLTPLFNKTHANPATPPALEEPLHPTVVWNGLIFAMPLAFVSWATLSLYLSLVPAYIASSLHALNPLVGAGALLGSQAASLVATLRLGNAAPERSGIIASIVMLVGFALLVVATSANIWALVVLATILVGAGCGVASAASFAVAGRVGRGQRPRIFARLFVAAYLGYSLPSLAVGAIAVHYSLAAGFTAIIVILTVIVALLPLLRNFEAKPKERLCGLAA